MPMSRNYYLQDHMRARGGFFPPLTPNKTFHKTPLRDVFGISLLFQGYEPSRWPSLHDSSTEKDLTLSYHTHKVSREFLIEVVLRCRIVFYNSRRLILCFFLCKVPPETILPMHDMLKKKCTYCLFKPKVLFWRSVPDCPSSICAAASSC